MAREEDDRPQQLEAREVNKISFLNYNLYCLPWVATLFAPRVCPLPAERANHFLKHIREYDILALQEVWNPRFRNIEKYATKHNYYVAGSSAPSSLRYIKLRVFGGGLMIISKFPIVNTKEALFDQGTGADMFVTKGVLYGKIEVGPNSYVHVFNTHLQASYGYEWDNSNPYAAIRKKQFKKISDFIHEVTKQDHHPIVLMGDFNVNAFNAPGDSSDSMEYKDMMQILQADRFNVIDVLKVLNQDAHPVTYEGRGVHAGDRKAVGGQRLDFIMDVRRKATPPAHTTHRFVQGSVIPFEVNDKIFTQISDHFGAHTVLEVPVSSNHNHTSVFVPVSPDVTVSEKDTHSRKGKRGNSVSNDSKHRSLAQVSISLQVSG